MQNSCGTTNYFVVVRFVKWLSFSLVTGENHSNWSTDDTGGFQNLADIYCLKAVQPSRTEYEIVIYLEL